MAFFKKSSPKSSFFDRHPNIAVFLIFAMIVGLLWIFKRVLKTVLFVGGFFYGLFVPEKVKPVAEPVPAEEVPVNNQRRSRRDRVDVNRVDVTTEIRAEE